MAPPRSPSPLPSSPIFKHSLSDTETDVSSKGASLLSSSSEADFWNIVTVGEGKKIEIAVGANSGIGTIPLVSFAQQLRETLLKFIVPANIRFVRTAENSNTEFFKTFDGNIGKNGPSSTAGKSKSTISPPSRSPDSKISPTPFSTTSSTSSLSTLMNSRGGEASAQKAVRKFSPLFFSSSFSPLLSSSLQTWAMGAGVGTALLFGFGVFWFLYRSRGRRRKREGKGDEGAEGAESLGRSGQPGGERETRRESGSSSYTMPLLDGETQDEIVDIDNGSSNTISENVASVHKVQSDISTNGTKSPAQVKDPGHKKKRREGKRPAAVGNIFSSDSNDSSNYACKDASKDEENDEVRKSGTLPKHAALPSLSDTGASVEGLVGEKEREEGGETQDERGGRGGKGLTETTKKFKVYPKPSQEGTTIELEVISGASGGKKVERKAEIVLGNVQPITIGRVSAKNELCLNESDVSSRHALVQFNVKSKQWELIDRGSLNGTLVNDQDVFSPPDLDWEEGGAEGETRRGKDRRALTNERTPSQPFALTDADIITCGSSSRILVRICEESLRVTPLCSPSSPFSLCVASDPMQGRGRGKGGKTRKMEDVALCLSPLSLEIQEFSLFCVFDGHAGVAAAESAKEILPRQLCSLLSLPSIRERVRREKDAGEIIRKAIEGTEHEMTNEDEGCTVTVLLVWTGLPSSEGENGREREKEGGEERECVEYFAQTGNLGDSHCVISVCGVTTVMTQDHRLTGPVERERLKSIGKGIKEGETRLCGMNIARVLGDKFLKSMDVGLSSSPFVSPAVSLGDGREAYAVIASDGLWDVMDPKRAVKISIDAVEAMRSALTSSQQGKSENNDPQSSSTLSHPLPHCHSSPSSARSSCAAEIISSLLLSKARAGRTTDNTTVVGVYFAK